MPRITDYSQARANYLAAVLVSLSGAGGPTFGQETKPGRYGDTTVSLVAPTGRGGRVSLSMDDPECREAFLQHTDRYGVIECEARLNNLPAEVVAQMLLGIVRA